MDSLLIAQYLMYIVLMTAIVAYATLDGFDLGVGCLHLFTKTDQERRIMINAIGPVWDGNSTWIVIGGGVLFAAFPKAFSILAPNLYTPFMLMLFGFMLRAAAIEFRSKRKSRKWRSFWDISFFSASLILAFIVGLVLGNLIHGMPLNNKGELEGGFADLLMPYTLVIAVLGISCFMMHGSLYVLMKTEGAFHDKIRKWTHLTIVFFLTLWIIGTTMTFILQPHMIRPFILFPELMVVPVLSLAAVIAIPVLIRKKRDGQAFLCSCLSIFLLLSLFLLGTFPNIARSTLDPAGSLTLMNSSVSELALWILVAVSLTGVPLSFFYFPYVYRVFKGKIKLDHMSY
ncbi:MAG: cytochrome d ubiquinol oxidase subunit II [Rhabdochlamydiaceae bacterium]